VEQKASEVTFKYRKTKIMANQVLTYGEQVEVWVKSVKGKDVRNVGTLGQLLSPMINDASPIYGRLHQLKVGASVNIIFKFVMSKEESNGDAEQVGGDKEKTTGDAEQVGGDKVVITECEYEISVLCEHRHPYLNDRIYIKTGQIIDSTFLKGKNSFLSFMLLQEKHS